MTAEGDCRALLWNLVDIATLFVAKIPAPFLTTGTNKVQISKNPKQRVMIKLWLQSDYMQS